DGVVLGREEAVAVGAEDDRRDAPVGPLLSSRVSRPVPASQRRTTLYPAEAMVRPSGLNANESRASGASSRATGSSAAGSATKPGRVQVMPRASYFRARRGFPVRASQRRIVPSPDVARATRASSRLATATPTARRYACRSRLSLLSQPPAS